MGTPSCNINNTNIKIQCMISGKSLLPYSVPKIINVIDRKNDEIIQTINIKNNSDILQFIDISNFRLQEIITYLYNINLKKNYLSVITTQKIERVFITSKHDKSIIPIGFYIYNDKEVGLDVNSFYELEGFIVTNPKNQTLTYLFDKAIKSKLNVEIFTLKDNDYKNLCEFNISKYTIENIYEHLEKLYESYAFNITKIYNRFDLHLAIDLAFRSVLSFKFDNEYVKKGWSDIIIVGDTRCGKGYVAENLAEYFNVGETVSGDNCSLAGLVGGLQQFDKNWTITWGKIPLNDKGLVIIDEAGELKDKEWSQLSRIRSEGIAEITKIHTQITSAKTRIIFIANPINRTISNYTYGIQALVDIIKTPEDIARFDYVLIVAHNEVNIDDINILHRDTVKSYYNNELEQKLIMWAWSRKDNEVYFDNDACKTIYELSKKLANEYSFTVPLIQGENIRIKLAKIAVCFAARFFNNKEKGKILYVNKVFVECAFYFLNLIYKKRVCGYYDLSRLKADVIETLTEVTIFNITKYFNAYKNKEQIYKCLINNNTITVTDISEYVNQPKEIAREIISVLLKYNCISKRYTFYVKTPGFTNWLKEQQTK